MAQQVIFGIGGYDETKPNNNIIEIIDIPDEPTSVDPVKQAALDKLMALGLTEEEAMAIAGL